jgi:hypothetical protein
LGRHGAVRSVSGSVARELSAREQAAHVLNRLAFGARPGEVDRVVAMGVDRWIDQQLRPDRVPDRDMEQVMAAYPALRMSSGDLIQEYPPAHCAWSSGAFAATRCSRAKTAWSFAATRSETVNS